MADQMFGLPIVTDDNVEPVLEHCTACGQPLQRFTTIQKQTWLLMAQCRPCNRVYVLDAMAAPDATDDADRHLID
jgi:hypothetical protein